jgi:dihydroorotase
LLREPLSKGCSRGRCKQPSPFYYMDALEMIQNLEQLDVKKIAADALDESRSEFIALNREQLLEGRLSTGDDISPSYFEDPYFKTPESAKRYSDWKDKITPHPKRNKGTPNLFIIGSFHQSIGMEVDGDEFEMMSDYKDAGSILSKFSEDIFGLNEEKAEALIDKTLAPTFYEKAHEQLGL